jgi:hypothetical protein
MQFEQLDNDDIRATGTPNELVEIKELIKESYAKESVVDQTHINICQALEGEGAERSFVILCNEVSDLSDIYVPLEEYVDALDEAWAAAQLVERALSDEGDGPDTEEDADEEDDEEFEDEEDKEDEEDEDEDLVTARAMAVI